MDLHANVITLGTNLERQTPHHNVQDTGAPGKS